VEDIFFLDVVVRQHATIGEDLTIENQNLVIWRETFFVLDFGLDRFDGVGRFYLESYFSLSEIGKEDLHGDNPLSLA